MSGLAPCPQCGAYVPDMTGAAHDYFEASPGCWAAYGTVLEREYSDRAFFANHAQTVDAYALQHPAGNDPRAVSSVMIHLVGATLMFAHNTPQTYRIEKLKALSRLTKAEPALIPHLNRPDDLGDITVADIVPLTDVEPHLNGVDRWARCVWEAWSDHHGMAEDLIKRIDA
jgi:hypothetical protein